MYTQKLGVVAVSTVGAILSFAIGCATPYQQRSFAGGYSDTRISKDTALVSFKGNGYTPKERVQLYLLYRCAEVTRQDGFDYFIVNNGETETRTGYVSNYSSTTNANAFGSGNYAVGSAQTYGSGSSMPIRKYGTEAMIKMFAGKKPPGDANAYDARETMQYLGPQLGLPG